MKRSIYTCVVFCVCGFAFGGEPTPAEPQSVLATQPAPAQEVVAAPAAACNACCTEACRQPRRTHKHSVAEACLSDGCQNYSVRTVEDEVTRRRWFGGGTVVRKNSRTVQRPVR